MHPGEKLNELLTPGPFSLHSRVFKGLLELQGPQPAPSTSRCPMMRSVKRLFWILKCKTLEKNPSSFSQKYGPFVPIVQSSDKLVTGIRENGLARESSMTWTLSKSIVERQTPPDKGYATAILEGKGKRVHRKCACRFYTANLFIFSHCP